LRLFAGFWPQLQFALRAEGGDGADDLGAVLAPGQHPAPLQGLTPCISWELATGLMIVTSWV